MEYIEDQKIKKFDFGLPTFAQFCALDENDLKIQNQIFKEKEVRYFDHYFEGLIDEEEMLYQNQEKVESLT